MSARVPVSLRTWTAKPPHLYPDVSHQVYCAACRFCVNVVAMTDMHVSRILIENVVEYARFAVSLKLQSEVNSSCPDVWTFCSTVLS